MAKSTRPSQQASAAAPRSNSRAESWLTAAERKLLDGTLGRSLAEATQKQLQATMARARTLRDKWRDLFNRQMKSSKRVGRGGDQVNSRSLDKAELFAAAVRRIEARLSELAAPAAPAAAEPRAAARPTNGPAKRVASKPAKRVASKPAKSKKARQAGALKAVAATGGAVGYDSRKQRSAKASATAARIKLDGLSTRRRGHTLAAGKRKQARRDGR